MLPLPLKALLRLYRAHPWLLLMSLVGLTLGVSLVVAIELLNHSARTNFVAARSQLAGEANYRLAPSGGLDEQLYVTLVRSQPDLNAMPELHAWLKDEQGRSFQLLGMDLFNPGPLRRLFGDAPDSQPDVSLSRADSVWLAAPEARRLDWQLGQSRTFVLGYEGQRPLTLTLAGTFEPGAVPMERLLVTDIGLAQPLLGKEGRLDRIVFKLSEQEATALQAALQSYDPHQPLWLEPISPALDASQLGDALALNLTALSLLAMAVGLFLVFNAQRFVQSVRRPQLAQLIILGMPPRRLLRWLTLEILILASIGTLLGLLLGSLLALALMGQLTQALADLYGPNPIDLLRLSPASLGKALVIGLAGTLAANLPGWWQLLRQSPLELREGNSRPPAHPWQRRGLASAILLLCALCLWRPETGLGGALFVAGGWLLAMALALPDLLRAVLGWLRSRLGDSLTAWLAVAETRYHLDRTAIAVMALQLAIAAAIGIGVMVSSFRSSVEIWLGQRLAADLYVTAPKGVAGSKGTLSEQTLNTILAAPDVHAASRRSVHPARWQGQPIEWAQMDFIPELKAAYPLLAGRWPATPDEVLASEPLTVRLGVKVGQRLEVSGEQGPHTFTVTGVYQDYGSDKGQILHAFEGGKVQSLALFSPHVDRLADHLRTQFGERVILLPAPAIHAAALRVFDQTFVVTELLKLLILGIAFVGIGSAFMVLGLARRGELQTLQSLGLSPHYCRRLLVWQGAGLGLLTALLALPVGYGLAWVLIEVVNPRAFGWRLAFEAAPLHAVTALLLAPVCGALASWYAVRRVV
ncbi:TPA: ABC transporter permease [Aeromonas dhakensis]|nr:ABC transporter permease [Aeromonas dhakensis]